MQFPKTVQGVKPNDYTIIGYMGQHINYILYEVFERRQITVQGETQLLIDAVRFSNEMKSRLHWRSSHRIIFCGIAKNVSLPPSCSVSFRVEVDNLLSDLLQTLLYFKPSVKYHFNAVI